MRPVGIGLSTLVQATEHMSVPAGLDDTALALLHGLRHLRRPATAVELAARVEEPVIGVYVGLHRLREHDLITVLRPDWLPARLSAWTRGHSAEHVRVDVLALVGADPDQPLTRSLGQITDTGALPVQTHLPGSMWVGVALPSPAHQVVIVAAAGVPGEDARWADLARAAAAVLIVGDPTVSGRAPGVVPTALAYADLPMVAMTAPTDGADPDPHVVRAVWGLNYTTPVVVGDPQLAPDLLTAIDEIGARS
ncbi:hypothetical protein ADL05_24550 [Nocardiopsis sp. NRRL B-16309]|nr:hypothetical protein ADL05_24550 [Nocardiopsis sp. NRRL B-16309]